MKTQNLKKYKIVDEDHLIEIKVEAANEAEAVRKARLGGAGTKPLTVTEIE